MKRNPNGLPIACALIVAALSILVVADPALAQNPFGQRAPAPSGFTGWLLAQQAVFYREMAAMIRAAKADGSAALSLIGISFLYGIFHAAGPGHGKAVISSYLIADDATWKRGALLAAIAALVQALSAITLVGIAALMLGATARTMAGAVRYIEIAAYALIILFGLYLLWKKGGALVAALRGEGGDHVHHHDHNHSHHHAHDHHGHSHGPEPAELTGTNWLRRGMIAAVAAGLRPCSGAILVLVFALSQGIFLTGIAATFAMSVGVAITVTVIALLAVFGKGVAVKLAGAMGGSGELFLRAIEVLGALLVLAFGVLLLTGYLASERLLPI